MSEQATMAGAGSRAKQSFHFTLPREDRKLLPGRCYLAETASSLRSISPISGFDMNCFQIKPVR